MAKRLLCKTDDVPVDSIKRVDPDGLPPIAVYNVDGVFYATDDTCTHGEASLSEGEIDGDLVECPFHAGCFEIATGQPAGAPCTVPIRAYDVVVEDGTVYAITED